MLAGYAIEGVLGRGGMGSVYRARHPRLPRVVALKVLNQDVSADPELRARFDREADIVARLDHPGIVAIHDRGIENGQPWLAMQYVEGIDTSKLDPAAVGAERAVRIVAEVAAALDYAHSRGVLHRDVKPANILLAATQAGRAERAVLTDFGIARLLSANTQLTSTGTFTATLAYASPEQLSGMPIDHRSDQYSLACTLFALLTGRAPFAAADPGQVVAGHLAHPVPPVLRPDVPPQLNAVIARATAKNPAERFTSAGEFAAAAQQAISGPAFAAPPYPPPHPVRHMPPHLPPHALHHPGWPAPRSELPVRNPWAAAWAMAIGCFAVLLTSGAVSVGLPSIQHDLDGTFAVGHWISDAYLLCATVPLLISGRLGDRFGPRTIYLVGVGLFMLGSVAAAATPTLPILIASRMVQGLGAALIIPQTVAVIVRLFPPGRRGAALGLLGGLGGLGVLLAPLVAAALVESFSWRLVFLLAVPLGLVMIVLAGTLVPALPTQRAAANPVGLLVSGGGVLLMALSLGQGIQQGWAMWGPVLIAGSALLGLFLFLQARAAAPLVSKAVLRDRNWWLAIVSTSASAAAVNMVSTVIVISLQMAEHMAVEMVGCVLAPAAVVTAVFAPVFGTVADRTHPAFFPAVGFGTGAAAAVAAGFAAGAEVPSPGAVFALIGAVLGFASACLCGPLAAFATDALAPAQLGTGSALYSTAAGLGTAIGGTASSAVFAAHPISFDPRLGDGLYDALREVGLLAGGLFVLCALAAGFFTRPSDPAGPARPPFHH